MPGLVLPKLATLYLPMLGAQIGLYWPAVPDPAVLAGQVEKETCPTLQSSRCWSPRAELRTSRERGVGLGQITKTANMDVMADIKKRYPGLFEAWSWEAPYQAEYQLRALVLMDRDAYRKLRPLASSDGDGLAFMLSGYNGGVGGLLADRRLCAVTPDCDQTVWFGNVERVSVKAKTRVHGYGQSFYDINRGYVKSILLERAKRYEGLVGSAGH